MSEFIDPTACWNIEVVSDPSIPGGEEVRTTHKVDPTKVYRTPSSRVHGIHFVGACKQARWEYLDSRTTYEPGDIIIVSYPKCGTTWSEQAVLLLLNGGDGGKLNPQFKNSYTNLNKDKPGKIWIETMIEQDPEVQKRMMDEGRPLTWEEFAGAPRPRVIKTHAPAQLLLGCGMKALDNLPDYVKVVVVSRNPFDACVSSYYHAFNPFKLGWPFDAWASTWLAGKVAHGSYFDWIKGWKEQADRHPGRIHWIEYETMKLDQHNALRRLGEYLGVNCDDELIDKVAQYSSFDHMKKQTEEAGGDIVGHLRKGTIGDWKNHFSKEMYDIFAERFQKELGDTGFYFPQYDC